MKRHNFKLIAALASILLSPIALQAMQKEDASPYGNIGSAINQFRQQARQRLSNEQFIRKATQEMDTLSSSSSNLRDTINYYKIQYDQTMKLLNEVDERLEKSDKEKESSDSLLDFKRKLEEGKSFYKAHYSLAQHLYSTTGRMPTFTEIDAHIKE